MQNIGYWGVHKNEEAFVINFTLSWNCFWYSFLEESHGNFFRYLHHIFQPILASYWTIYNFNTLSMKKILYFFAIFFLGLFVASMVFQSIFYFQLGSRVPTLQSYLGWYILIAIINLMVSFVMLKYYHHKKYWFTFSLSIIVTIASLCYFIIVYSILAKGELRDYFTISFLVYFNTKRFIWFTLIPEI